MSRTLKEEFQHSLDLIDTLKRSSHPFVSEEYQLQVKEVLESLDQCSKMISSLGIFSDNESWEDLKTNEIVYLTIPYHKALALERVRVQGAEDRKNLVYHQVKSYNDFLKSLDHYGLLPKTHASRLESFLAGQLTIENVASKVKELSDQLRPTDAAVFRAEKIAKHKAEKELEGKLNLLQKTEAKQKDPDAPNVDEDEVRDLRKEELKLYTLKSLNTLEMLSMEVQMLARAPSRPEPPIDLMRRAQAEQDQDGRERQIEDVTGYTDKLEKNPLTEAGRPILDSMGKINRPFKLVSTRQQLQSKVRGTGQYLPTMSVEDYLEEEKRRGGIIEGGGEIPSTEKSDNDMDDEAADRETMKAREWDEFVEANPKGSGNTMNMG
ncbi:TAP42-like protein [Yarrowia lipolytica]|jgi:immunoglobulin-binding protein 1|uniref:TAP42-like protein n=1 Tax=Yarrowia lipolytica TaxID=4952 RepID=A0A1D8N495_YARLL|nr:hypothetical protein YALI1_A09576g [Yarrowia lipolytica]KAB8282930.1 TAP42-like protein [Yarrowia lipolytica]KAE8170957.1 TAP42-like protein [Yarrowia lipolytica]KAJ8051527.1 TAP42-like protein [Yarrowia lipolytica]RMI94608.1 TAP42-like protein [Yarrowia lipolytica]